MQKIIKNSNKKALIVAVYTFPILLKMQVMEKYLRT